MRRLTAWIYRALFGLQIVSQRQHIINLEQQLVNRCAEQAALLEAIARSASRSMPPPSACSMPMNGWTAFSSVCRLPLNLLPFATRRAANAVGNS